MKLRQQQFFHHKFDPESADYAHRHIYKGVYTPNERINPFEERKISVKEYIRKACPKNMRNEPQLILIDQKVEDPTKKKDKQKKFGGLSQTQKIYFKKMRNEPFTLAKNLAYKNSRVDNLKPQKDKNGNP